MAKKRIAFAVGCLEGGGTERVISIWASELAKRDLNVFIVTYYHSPDEYSVDESVQFQVVAESKAEYLKLSKKERFLKLRHIIKSIAPDYIIPFLPSMQILISLACIGLRVKKIETIRNNPWIIESELGAIKTHLWKRCFRIAEKIIVQGQGQAEYFGGKYMNKTRVISNPLSDCYLSEMCKAYSDYAKEFIAVGRIDEQKNYPLMIKAFSRVCSTNPHIRLRIFGTGSAGYTRRISELISSIGMENRILLMGRSDNIASAYLSSDVFIIASNYEGMPNALAEAMASGLVCISTDCKTGPSDLIDNCINGFLFPCGDEDKLTELIAFACDMNKDTMMVIGKRAKARATNLCNLEDCIQKLCLCFK